MLLSLALILLLAVALSQLFIALKLPGLIGMLLSGVLLGPFVFDLISPDLLDLSADLRQIALIVILLRAGLSLDLEDLKKVGRPAILLSFVPAMFEIIAITIFAPMFFDISVLDAAILGAVLGAVSPAVVVPRMIRLMESGYGKTRSVPQLVMAGASVDDIFVIVLFTSLMQSAQGSPFSVVSLLVVPLTIVAGVTLGLVVGLLIVRFFKKVHLRDTVKVLLIFGISFLFLVLEQALKTTFEFSGLIAVMALGATLLKKYAVLAKRLVSKFGKIWIIAEIMLFVLVGAAIDITVIPSVGLFAILLLLIGLCFRMVGVYVALLRSKLTSSERLFVAISYLPKATVQAAIGAIPLSMGMASGNLILTVAVLAIIITAPLGAILIDISAKRLLTELPLA